MKIDDLNISIVRHLREGRKSFKVIAEDLGVSENTVRSRVSKLEEEKTLIRKLKTIGSGLSLRLNIRLWELLKL